MGEYSDVLLRGRGKDNKVKDFQFFDFQMEGEK